MITPPFHPAPGPIVVNVTEDEATLRTLATEVLAKAGFAVVEAAHADDALAIMKSRGRCAIYRCPDAWVDGWPRIGALRATSLA